MRCAGPLRHHLSCRSREIETGKTHQPVDPESCLASDNRRVGGGIRVEPAHADSPISIANRVSFRTWRRRLRLLTAAARQADGELSREWQRALGTRVLLPFAPWRVANSAPRRR